MENDDRSKGTPDPTANSPLPMINRVFWTCGMDVLADWCCGVTLMIGEGVMAPVLLRRSPLFLSCTASIARSHAAWTFSGPAVDARLHFFFCFPPSFSFSSFFLFSIVFFLVISPRFPPCFSFLFLSLDMFLEILLSTSHRLLSFRYSVCLRKHPFCTLLL